MLYQTQLSPTHTFPKCTYFIRQNDEYSAIIQDDMSKFKLISLSHQPLEFTEKLETNFQSKISHLPRRHNY